MCSTFPISILSFTLSALRTLPHARHILTKTKTKKKKKKNQERKKCPKSSAQKETVMGDSKMSSKGLLCKYAHEY